MAILIDSKRSEH